VNLDRKISLIFQKEGPEYRGTSCLDAPSTK